jgi:hypothetical protein
LALYFEARVAECDQLPGGKQSAFASCMTLMATGLWLLLALPGAPKSEAILPPSTDLRLPGESIVALDKIVQLPTVRPVLATPVAPVPIKLQKRPEMPLTVGQTRAWLAMTAVQHSAAAFDAWSTRVSITSGNGKELNPLMRPFAGSGAIYGAIQLAPVATDYWARRLMHSKNSTLRKLWWVPQAASTAGFMFSGANNLRVANGR